MRLHLALFAVLFAAACGAPQQAETAAPAAESASPAAASLSVRDAWASPTPGGAQVSAGYLTIVNGAEAADTLVSATSPRAASVEVHEMSMDGAVMRMRQVAGGLAIPSGGEVSLAPGGNHLMFMGVTQPFAEGESIPVTLTFANAGAVEVQLPVQREAPMAMGGH